MKTLKGLFAFLLGVVLSLLPILPITAQSASPFYWDFINVDMQVLENGDMQVMETQKYVFTASHTNERYRYIPLDKVKQITDIAVFEGERSLPITTGVDNNQQWIQWQHKLNPPNSHTFVLKYRVVGGLQVDRNNTSVYWKAIFAERKAPINSAKVTVKLPEVLAGKVLSFQNYGVSATARQINPTTFEFTADRAVQPGEELEVKIPFPTEVLNLAPLNSIQPLNPINDDETSFRFSWKNLWISSLALLLINRWIRFILKITVCIAIFLAILFLLIPFMWTSPLSSIVIIPLLFIFASLILGGILTDWNDSKCPQCNKPLQLKRSSKVLRQPTTTREGRQLTVHNCNNCSYHHEFESTIPLISFGGGGDGGGGGGGDGGGGGGGDGGGGGGGG